MWKKRGSHPFRARAMPMSIATVSIASHAASITSSSSMALLPCECITISALPPPLPPCLPPVPREDDASQDRPPAHPVLPTGPCSAAPTRPERRPACHAGARRGAGARPPERAIRSAPHGAARDPHQSPGASRILTPGDSTGPMIQAAGPTRRSAARTLEIVSCTCPGNYDV